MPNRTVSWARIGDVQPDLKGEQHHFVALDDDGDVGIVRQIEAGGKTGQWVWSLTRVHPARRSTCRDPARRKPAARRRWRSWNAGGTSGNGTGWRINPSQCRGDGPRLSVRGVTLGDLILGERDFDGSVSMTMVSRPSLRMSGSSNRSMMTRDDPPATEAGRGRNLNLPLLGYLQGSARKRTYQPLCAPLRLGGKLLKLTNGLANPTHTRGGDKQMLKPIGLAGLFGSRSRPAGFGRKRRKRPSLRLGQWEWQGRSRADCRCQPAHPARRRRICLGAALPQPPQGRAIVSDAHFRNRRLNGKSAPSRIPFGLAPWVVTMVCALAIPLALMWLDATAETIGFTSVMPDFLAASRQLYDLADDGADYADRLDGCDRDDLIQAIGKRARMMVSLAHGLEETANRAEGLQATTFRRHNAGQDFLNWGHAARGDCLATDDGKRPESQVIDKATIGSTNTGYCCAWSPTRDGRRRLATRSPRS